MSLVMLGKMMLLYVIGMLLSLLLYRLEILLDLLTWPLLVVLTWGICIPRNTVNDMLSNK